MVQNVSAQYQELAAKMSQMIAQSAGAKTSQNSSFKSYMEQTSKRDAQPAKQEPVKKEPEKPANDHPAQNTQKTDNANNQNEAVKPEDGKEIGDTEQTNQKGNQQEVMIDLAAFMQMYNINMVEVKPEGASLEGAQIAAAGETVAFEGPAAGEVVQAAVMTEEGANTQVQTTNGNQQNLQANVTQAKDATTQQTAGNEAAVKTTDTQQQAAATVENKQNTAEQKTQTQDNAQQAANAKEGENGPKTVEVKVETDTKNQTDAKSSQTAKEDGVDPSMMQTQKAEQGETPVITVKVGENGQIDGQQMGKEVAEAIIKKFPNVPNQFEIQLNPKNLGKITIQILFENNQTMVHLAANNAKASMALADCAKQIGTLIQQHTGNETIVTVEDDKGLGNQQKQQGNRENAESQQKENAEKQRRQEQMSQDFVQQMRLGLFDGEAVDNLSRYL